MLCSSGSRAAEWMATPSARLGAEFVDNPLLVPKDNSTYTGSTGDGTADLSADIAKHGEHYDVTVDPRAFFSRYLRRSLFDHDDQYLNLNGDVKTQRTTWQGSVNAARDTALTSELGLTGITDTNRRHENLSINAGPSYQLTERLTVAATAGWLASHYVDAGNTGLIDYRYTTGDANATYALTERTQIGLDGSVGELSASLGLGHSTTYAVQATLTSHLTELWTASLSGGPSRADFDDGTSANGAVYSASLTHHGQLFDLNARVSNSVTPTGRGVLTKYEQVQLSLSGSITERLSSVSTVQYAHDRDYFSTSPVPGSNYSLYYYTVQEELHWKLDPSWSVDLTAQDQHQSTVVPPQLGENAAGYRVSVGLTWTGRPRRL